MHIVVAPNAFKGSLTALEAAHSIENGIRRVLPDATIACIPVADGGDGTLEVLVYGTGGTLIEVPVTNPLGQPMTASYGLSGDGKTAIIELASASGLRLLDAAAQNPAIATTYGTGQLIRAALDRGCQKIVMGIGGSATVDGGTGIAQALGVRFLDENGHELVPGGLALSRLHHIDFSGIDARLKSIELIILCDVDNPLVGEYGAARVFAPQKGASPHMVEELESALMHYGQILNQSTDIDVLTLTGGGAAGGVAAGLVALFNATLQPGIDYVLHLLDFSAKLQGADLVITGEGSLDNQSIHGKAPVGVAKLAKQQGIPVVALAGRVAGRDIYAHGIDAALSIVPQPITLPEAIQKANVFLEDTAEQVIRLICLKHHAG